MQTNKKIDCFCFDIDGTLADHTGVRSPFDESRVSFDVPIEPVWKVLEALYPHYKIIFVSGRTDNCRTETYEWLFKNLNIKGKDKEILTLYMRKTGDRRKDSIIKKEIYDEFIFPNYNVIGVFDDRLQVCKMLYDNHIFCFNVNQGLKDF